MVKYSAEKNWLTFMHGALLAVFNFAGEPRRIALPAGEWDLVLASEASSVGGQPEVPAGGTLVYKNRAD